MIKIATKHGEATIKDGKWESAEPLLTQALTAIDYQGLFDDYVYDRDTAMARIACLVAGGEIVDPGELPMIDEDAVY